MIEIRIHGRGGQGAVTTGQLIAIASFLDGKFSQTFPMFGVERAGAPVEAYVRISTKPINLRSQVYEPDIVLVLDPSLLKTVDVTKGLKPGGYIIVNSNKNARELGVGNGYNVYTFDATKVALDVIHKPIMNTPVLGAFAKITRLITLGSLKKAVKERFKAKEVAEFNNKVIEKVYSQVKT